MSPNNLKTSIQYNSMAEKYSQSFLEFNQESIQAYFDHFDMGLAGKKILDLGCGTGYDLSRIASYGALIYGIDGSKEMVRLASEKNPQGIIQVARFDELPFEDTTFDVIISKWALQNSSQIDPIYEEIIRVLKPQGKLIYLACHPIRQFMEKKRNGKNYFEKEIVESTFFDGQITALEPSHTMNEYLSPTFFKYFILDSYEEGFDSAAEKVNDDIYPSYFIITASAKKPI